MDYTLDSEPEPCFHQLFDGHSHFQLSGSHPANILVLNDKRTHNLIKNKMHYNHHIKIAYFTFTFLCYTRQRIVAFLQLLRCRRFDII